MSVILTVTFTCQTNCMSLDTNKITGQDGISAKFFQISVSVTNGHLSNIIPCDLSENKYSEHAKTATVRSIFKNNDRKRIKNCSPVSLMNIFP